MHALLRLLATQPQLLAEHAEAYAALLSTELPRISAGWQRSALLKALAVSGAVVAALLAGVGVMLWAAAAPEVSLRAPWVLVAVPLLPLLAGAACALAARSGSHHDAVARLRLQVAADLLMLREASPA